MPKLCNSSAAAKNFSGESGESSSTAKGAGFPGHSKNSNGNVPNGHHNGNKSVSLVPYDADDDDDDDEEENQENQKRFVGSKKRNGRNHSAEDDDDDDSDEDVER